jgi:hypothetical protein
MKRKLSWLVLVAVCLAILPLSGCIKPYQQEMSKIVMPHETAFYVPLEGDVDQQKKMDSVAAFEEGKVASKRIIIPTRWNKTGRLPNSGEWIQTARLVVTDRSVVTRHWTSEASSGTNPSNQSIPMESRDSIPFNAPFACSAYVPENMAATFLYWYPGKSSLASVMDNEVRNKIQECGTEFAGQYALNELRSKKKEMNEHARAIVIPFFKERGIVITVLGLAGGYEYRNPEIQTAIDNIFIAQQEKNIESAKLKAMEKREARMTGDGQAEAARARTVAQGNANATKTLGEAKGESEALVGSAQADAIKQILTALEQATSPVFVDYLWLQVEEDKVDKWDGNVPLLMSGQSNVPGVSSDRQ